MEHIKTFQNPGDWTKFDIRKIQNEINSLWNSYTHLPELFTILVQVISKSTDGKLTDTSHWVELPKKPNWSNVVGIKIFKVRQEVGN